MDVEVHHATQRVDATGVLRSLLLLVPFPLLPLFTFVLVSRPHLLLHLPVAVMDADVVEGWQWPKVGLWILLAVVVFMRGIITVLFTWGDYLQQTEAELADLPSLLPIYARHLTSLISKPRKFGPKSRLEPLSLTITKGAVQR